MKRILLTLSSAISLSFTACVVPPSIDQHGHVHSSPTSASLNARGVEEFVKIKKQKKISKNAQYNAQVRRVAARLKPVIHLFNAKWEFVVFEDPTPNAFALPGGKVGIHTGMFQITQTDAGLAAVLGHEISHVTSNHVGKQQKRRTALVLGAIALDQIIKHNEASNKERAAVAGLYEAGSTVAVTLPHSRRHELEADRIGTIYMAKAGYDPREALAMWQRFARYNKKQGSRTPEFLRTHPLDSTRIQALKDFMPIAMQEYKSR